MKLQRLPRLLNRLFLLALFSMLAAIAAIGQNSGDSQVQLPRGNYSVSCRPYTGQGYNFLPVLVTSVTSNLGGGIAITKIAIENSSSQAVDAVKLTWYLSKNDSPEAILQQGQTPLLRIPGGIQAGSAEQILFPVISFAQAYRPLLKSGVPNGVYLIQVAVAEVRFEDGSTQTLITKNGKVSEAVTARASHTFSTSLPFCPDQTCDTSIVNGVPLGYRCMTAAGESCANSSDGQSCNSSICGSND